MSATTATWALPYPTGGDEPCDYAAIWCDFAERVDALVSDVQSSVNLATAVPLVSIYNDGLITPELLAFNTVNAIPFAVEQIDTDNMANLVVNPLAVIPSRAGVYQVLAFAVHGDTPTGGVFGGFELLGFGNAPPPDWVVGVTSSPSLAREDSAVYPFTPVGQPWTVSAVGAWAPGNTGVGMLIFATGIIYRVQLVLLWIGNKPS